MIVEIKCPDCEKIHFFDIGIVGLEIKSFPDSETARRYAIDNIKVNAVLPSDMVLENL